VSKALLEKIEGFKNQRNQLRAEGAEFHRKSLDCNERALMLSSVIDELEIALGSAAKEATRQAPGSIEKLIDEVVTKGRVMTEVEIRRMLPAGLKPRSITAALKRLHKSGNLALENGKYSKPPLPEAAQ
jgi:alkylated DNA nucleotide flippase Atl1